MTDAVIVDAVRTPIGRRNGLFKDYHPVDLASRPLEALVDGPGVAIDAEGAGLEDIELVEHAGHAAVLLRERGADGAILRGGRGAA